MFRTALSLCAALLLALPGPVAAQQSGSVANLYAPDASFRSRVCAGGNFRETMDREAIETAGGRTARIGFQHNRLVLIGPRVYRNGLQGALMSPDKLGPEGVTRTQALLEVVQNERDLALNSAELPLFWGPRFRRHTLIAEPPLYGDRYHDCDGDTLRILPGLYALFYMQAEPLVQGDLCDLVPRIVFGPGDPGGQDWLYSSALSDGDRLEGWKLVDRHYDHYYGDRFVETMRLVGALREAQCGSLPAAFEILVIEQTHTGSFRDNSFDYEADTRPVYQAFLVIEDGDMILDVVMETDDILVAERRAEAAERHRIKMREYRARSQELTAVGALIFFSGMTLFMHNSFCMEQRQTLADHQLPDMCRIGP